MSLKFDITMTCNNCNSILEYYQSSNDDIIVDPCEHCLAAEYDRGYDLGYENAVGDC